MRSKFLRISALAVLILFVIACRKDRPNMDIPTASTEVKFSSIISGQIRTKAVNDTWETNDAIGVYMKTGNGLSNILSANKSYTTAGNGNFNASSADQTLYYPENGSNVDFIAYYPYKQNLNGNMYPVDVANQTSQGAIDLMYANNATGLNKVSTNAQLTFTHQLSKIEMVVKNGVGVPSLENIKVNINGLKTAANFDLATGAISGQANVADIQAKTSVRNNLTVAEAVLLPTTDENPAKVVFIIGSKSYSWTMPAGTKFEQGKKYNYEIELVGEGGNSGIAATLNATITNWIDVPSGTYSLNKEVITTNPPSISGYMETPVITTDDNMMYVFHKSPNNDKVRNYAMLYDKRYKMAYWVAYPLHSSYVGGSGRTDAWQFDPSIPQNSQVDLSSSFGNGYDRGHQIPSGDRTSTRELNQTTFYYSNMTAQVSSMNQGIWNNLEQQVRSWMAKGDTMYVVTGAAIKTASDATITYIKGSAIPKYYYKALALKKGDAYYTIGFKINNQVMPTGVTYNNYRINVSDLEKETGFTFFPKLTAANKTTIDNTIWN
ncbi:fimbrillin family protein [uncultured Mucilaginibacter sp.]|uniref:fimbrillin family protein n=1 Tax=uncultured Mucilaginibacter sp. TaxID=797541 RepID=UPI0025DB000B|nr:fimbrillin family protein [uncultured Mucilaginibacter sp.]